MTGTVSPGALYMGTYGQGVRILFKLQLVMFFEDIRSDRQLTEQAQLNLAQRWYPSYHLDEPLPDRSSLIKIRQRVGLETFRRVFWASMADARDAASGVMLGAK